MTDEQILELWQSNATMFAEAKQIAEKRYKVLYGSSSEPISSYAEARRESAMAALDRGDVETAKQYVSGPWSGGKPFHELVESWISWENKIVETNGQCLI